MLFNIDTKPLFNWVSLGVIIATFLALLMPETALAFTDATVDVLPPSRADKPLLENIIWILMLGAMFFVAAATLFGMADSIMAIFSTLGDARKNGEWGTFLRTLVIILVILVFVLFLAVFVWKVVGSLAFNPAVSVG